MYVNKYVYIYIHMYTCKYVNIAIYIYANMYDMYICMCIHMYVYT